jgi:hypothetical protein
MTVVLRDLPEDTVLTGIMSTLLERTGKDMATLLRDFAEHNMTLFDARLIHAIVSHEYDNVFVCTGVAHVHKINKALEQLGYQTKALYGENNLKTLEDRGVIGRTFVYLNDLDYLAIDLENVFAKA